MDIKLAGYNVSKDLLDDYKEVLERIQKDDKFRELNPELVNDITVLSREEPTPEVISAAYARISRDSRVISELRAEARKEVEKSRKSNQAIVFGLGHHSVAEHVQLNFDIVNISRRAIEGLEERRIGSGYTEKSQRYITLDGDFLLPKEFNGKELEKFRRLVDEQIDFYNQNIDKLIQYQFNINPEIAKVAKEKQAKGVSNKMNSELNKLEGLGKEDARYALSMATMGQVGTSFNARALEHTIRTLRSSELIEERDLAQELYVQAKSIVPSLIILADPQEFEKQFKVPLKDDGYKYTKKNLKRLAERTVVKQNNSNVLTIDPLGSEDLDCIIKGSTLLLKEGDIDLDITAAIMFKYNGLTLQQAYSAAENIINSGKGQDFFKEALKYISEFDSLPREFEFSNLKYSAVISASNFAQMKRHRIMTLLAQDYNPNLGYTIPMSIIETGLDKQLLEVYNKSSELYEKFRFKHGVAAEYLLTNGHRRRVAINLNPRELYHISRLRMDSHAQWDIRNTATEMVALAKEVAPLTFILACGKNEFNDVREGVFDEHYGTPL